MDRSNVALPKNSDTSSQLPHALLPATIHYMYVVVAYTCSKFLCSLQFNLYASHMSALACATYIPRPSPVIILINTNLWTGLLLSFFSRAALALINHPYSPSGNIVRLVFVFIHSFKHPPME